MIEELLTIKNIDVYFVVGIILLFGILESISGFLKNSNRKKGDWIQEILSFLVLGNLVKPIIILLMFGLGNFFFTISFSPSINSSCWFVCCIYTNRRCIAILVSSNSKRNSILMEIASSTSPSRRDGFFVSYRNAPLYYLLMPNIWWVALILFLGGRRVVALGLILKQLIIIGSHSRLKWDKPFYQYAALRPIIKILESIIITPAFHHIHHGTYRLDTAS